ncbi:hypothetical protein [Castellaniella sp.]|uniref:hypothetical protein n=1 Tax=Castellaniella sp. TaxID=1955812 RepID=UPI002AFE6776|nr:hypothetical protein [Castellaniella sp.]
MTRIRQDFLISIVLADAADGTRYRDVLRHLVPRLDAAFQFWEVVVAIPEASREETAVFTHALKGLTNLRILRLSAAGSFYRRRLAGVTEAIGDVVILSALDEVINIDIPMLAQNIYAGGEAIVCTGQQSNWSRPSSVVEHSIGWLSGYRVDLREMLTIGFPRAMLENMLQRPDAEILLRFEPLSGIFTFQRYPVVEGHTPTRRNWRDSRRRVALMGDMMINASPRTLRGLAFLSTCVAGIAVLYGIYAMFIWLLKADVAAGWLTTSLLQSLTTFLLGISIAAISTGLVRIFEMLSNEGRYAIVDEINTVDLIGNIQSTNVELNTASPYTSGIPKSQTHHE